MENRFFLFRIDAADEDQGTLDEDGFTSVVNILKSCENQNIFIISHSTSEFDQISDRSLVARKVNGFSEIFEN